MKHNVLQRRRRHVRLEARKDGLVQVAAQRGLAEQVVERRLRLLLRRLGNRRARVALAAAALVGAEGASDGQTRQRGCITNRTLKTVVEYLESVCGDGMNGDWRYFANRHLLL